MDNSDRDRSIESLLRRREGVPAQSTDQCVDSESLAAWMEGGLPADARATLEKHAAGCARCQALFASLARTAADSEVRPWWRSITAKWLVPAAAIATALVVWISVGREPVRSTMQPAPAVEASRRANLPEAPAAAPVVPLADPVASTPRRVASDASANKPAPKVAPKADPEARERQKLATIDRLQDRRDVPAESKSSTPPLPVVGSVTTGAVDAARPQGQTAAETPARTAPPPAAAPPSPVRASPAPAAGSPPPPTPPPAANASADAKPAPVGSVAETVAVLREAPEKEFAARGGTAALGAAALEIRSADLNYRWRILPPTGIQRSTDGGTTWSVVDPLPAATRAGNGTATVLTAGSSPSRDICWIVGRAGVVLLSTNGATWDRRPFSEAVDLTAVRASDARSAIVTAVDGRQFSTVDGGATWVTVK